MLPALPNSKPAKATLLDVVDTGERLIAVGARGLITWSTDDAETWHQASVPVSQTLTSVFFATPELGWATGHEGLILATTDGGLNWTVQQTGRDTVKSSIPFLEARIAELQAQADAAEDPTEKDDLTFAVEDAEAALDDANISLEDGPTDPLLDIWFKNPQEGFSVGAYGRLLRTSDGGKTWIPAIGALDNPDKMHLNKVVSSEDGTIYIAGEAGVAFRSDDQGASWIKLDVPYDGSLFGVVTLDNERLVVYGLRGNIFLSPDKGASWRKLAIDNASTLIGGAKIDGDIILVGASGAVLKGSVNGGDVLVRFHPSRATLSTIMPLEGDELLLVGTKGLFKIQSFNELKGEAL
jgi:photosystem II stability/assembly factor-like uncharacterized protein